MSQSFGHWCVCVHFLVRSLTWCVSSGNADRICVCVGGGGRGGGGSVTKTFIKRKIIVYSFFYVTAFFPGI